MMSSSHLPHLTIVVVTWNSAQTISSTLQSIDEQRWPKEAVSTVLVDNGSIDQTPMLVRSQFP